MPLHLWTSTYRYEGPNRIDVTRVGCDRAAAGQPAEGLPFAPSSRILWPAKAHLDLVGALDRRAASLPGSEAGAAVALLASDLLTKTEEAYRRLYVAEMRSSWKKHRPAWDALLAREAAVLVCFCPRREPGEGQRHTCHRHHLAACLVACGAIDEGERELPPPREPSKPRPSHPLESLVAVSGCRPPPAGSSRDDHALYREILADVTHTVSALPPGSVVVHGGAEGVDSAAGRAAKGAGLGEMVYRPWYDAWGRGAPIVRNVYVATAGRLIAWPSSWSSPNGTPGAIRIARSAGVEVDERRVG